MKAFKSLLILNLFSAVVLSQNLVQNNSFEIYTACTNGVDDIASWGHVPGNQDSPDYFNACQSLFAFDVPLNFAGNREAYDGSAYIGLIMGFPTYEYREYIQTKLSMPLIQGQICNVSFRVSCGQTFKYACNNIGANLSVLPLVNNMFYVIPATPQIIESAVITETEGWQEVSGTFIASGGEEYLTLGNFYDNANTSLVLINSSAQYSQAYYYLDNVQVTVNPLNTEEWHMPDFKVYPVPSSDFVTLETRELEIRSIELHSILGLIKRFLPTDRNLLISDLSNGAYFLIIINDLGQKFFKKIIKI